MERVLLLRSGQELSLRERFILTQFFINSFQSLGVEMVRVECTKCAPLFICLSPFPFIVLPLNPLSVPRLVDSYLSSYFSSSLRLVTMQVWHMISEGRRNVEFEELPKLKSLWAYLNKKAKEDAPKKYPPSHYFCLLLLRMLAFSFSRRNSSRSSHTCPSSALFD